jgi:hypothetical protein
VPVTRARSFRSLAPLAFLALLGCNHLSGSLTSSSTPLGTWTFQATRCTADASSLVLSSRTDPIRYVSIDPQAPGEATPTVLGGRALNLTVLDLSARDGAPLVIPAAHCRVLSTHASGSFSTRINGGPWVTSYSGSADIDCYAPDEAHRFVGHFDFTCPQQ